MTYEDILYDETDGVATITINRPDRYNAFRGQTCMELIDAFHRAGWNKDIGVIVFTGAGEKAFCTGGDQGAHEGQYDGRGLIGLPVEELQRTIREVPKPVIARVNGFAIGGGHVLHVICDLSIASETAVFGLIGDICLALPGSRAFRIGLFAFLAGHILYVWAFAGLARPEDCPGIIALRASDDANFITGQVISVSGGLTMAG